MVKNDFRQDISKMRIWSGKTRKAAAKEAGFTPQYVTQLGSKVMVVNKQFTNLAEAFGYDIEVQYIKRCEDAGVAESE